MPFCSRCGVEVDSVVRVCPLCDAPIQILPLDNGAPWPSEEAPSTSSPPMSSDERKALARTITTLGFLIPASVVLTVDWFLHRRISWSLIVLASLAAGWLWALVSLNFSRRPYMLVTTVTLIALGTQTSLGLLIGNIRWLIPVGIPVVVGAGLLAAGVISMARRAGGIGGNLAGWILIALSLLSTIIDILLSAWLFGYWRPGWSIIVASTLIPIAILLLYLHYRPTGHKRLRRYFHV